MIQKILQKYKAQRDYYYPNIENPYKIDELKNASGEKENKLREKWAKHIPPGWYGFSFGRPTPDCWFDIIDEFLDYLLTIDPALEIHQIKMKFGSCLMYLHYNIPNEELREFVELQIEKLEWTLFDKKLIY